MVLLQVLATLAAVAAAVMAILPLARKLRKKFEKHFIECSTATKIVPIVDCMAEYEKALYGDNTIVRDRLLAMARKYPRAAYFYCTHIDGRPRIESVISFWPIKSDSYERVMQGGDAEKELGASDLDLSRNSAYWYIGDICRLYHPLPLHLDVESAKQWIQELENVQKTAKFKAWREKAIAASKSTYYMKFAAMAVEKWLRNTKHEGPVTFFATAATLRGLVMMERLDFTDTNAHQIGSVDKVGQLEFADVQEIREYIEKTLHIDVRAATVG